MQSAGFANAPPHFYGCRTPSAALRSAATSFRSPGPPKMNTIPTSGPTPIVASRLGAELGHWFVRWSAAWVLIGGVAAWGIGSAWGQITPAPQTAAPRTAAVLDQAIEIGGPTGFCIDPAQTRDSLDEAFLLLGSCQALDQNSRSPAPSLPAILTASVGPPGGMNPAKTAEALDAFFLSKAGMATLSRSGTAERVTILETFSRAGVFYLHVHDESQATGPALQKDFWRALLNLHGHLISLNVIGLETAPLPPEDGRDLLTRFVRRVKALNRADFGSGADK